MGRNNFHPPLQIKALRELSDLGYIQNFEFVKDVFGKYRFLFLLTNQEIGGEAVSTDFSKYKIRVECSTTLPPKIFIEEPVVSKMKHMYKDRSLCLYHWSKFKWGDDKSIAQNLIPWVYMWIYFYELWLKTDKWYGDEYLH